MQYLIILAATVWITESFNDQTNNLPLNNKPPLLDPTLLNNRPSVPVQFPTNEEHQKSPMNSQLYYPQQPLQQIDVNYYQHNSELGAVNTNSGFQQISERCTGKPNYALGTSSKIFSYDNVMNECPKDHVRCPNNGSSIYEICRKAKPHSPICSCDENCHKTGTCCPSVQFDLKQVDETKLFGLKCGSHLISNQLQIKLTKAKCSSDWMVDNNYPAQSIKQQCENPKTNDLLAKVMVSSVETQEVFKNVFCAICNYQEGHLRFWTSNVVCSTAYQNQNQIQTQPSSELSGFISDESTICDITLDPLQSPPVNLINCDQGMITDCREDYGENQPIEVIKKCAAYYSPVVQFDPLRPDNYTYFKNKYCAQCNWVNKENLYCLDGYLPYSPNSGGQFPSQVVASFDLNADTIRDKCKSSESLLFDPFKNECRSVFCKVSSGEDRCRWRRLKQEEPSIGSAVSTSVCNILIFLSMLVISLTATTAL